jgi:fibronectin-binding autotransporter adhesin
MGLVFLAAGIGLAAGVPSSARAATLYWDGDGVAPLGGSGTWNTTSSCWWNGSQYLDWNNASVYDAVLDTAAGTVTVGTAVTVHNLTLNTDGYSLSGSQKITLAYTSTFPTITVATGNATISVPIAGSAGLIMTGSGTLTLTGSNSYGGGTTIQTGVLAIAGDCCLGAADSAVTFPFVGSIAICSYWAVSAVFCPILWHRENVLRVGIAFITH